LTTEQLLDQHQLAEALGVHWTTVRNWRVGPPNFKEGPKFLRINGRLVRYRWSDVEKWLQTQEAKS